MSCETVTRSTTAQTAGTLVVNVAGEDRRFIHAVGANAEFTGRELSPAAIRDSRAIYVGGIGLNPALTGENVAEVFRTAHAAGAVTVLDVVVGDPHILPAMLAAALPETDLFLPNIDEARAICGLETPLEQARHFRELGAKTVVITLGGGGAVVMDADDALTAAAYPVDCV
ncbi:MAG: hypothetical protein KDA75_13635, partial [Planctomycetaceae bacterium]|nr:hypothetical protein [Planctomycetaceae bacterium]